MKVIIAGGRDFNDYDLLDRKVSSILNSMVNTPMDEFIIITGGARGADRLGDKYALNNKFNRTVIPADWDKYGKSAGYIRNSEMARVGDMLIAFWDGKSKGTKNMIDQMSKLNKKVYIIEYGK